MKKNIIAMLVSGMFLIMSCGPSAEEIAAAEKKVQDSIAEVQRLADEAAMQLEQQRIQDSLAMVMEQMRQDSIMMAEELARTKKGGTKPKAPVKAEPKGTGVSKGGSEIMEDGTKDGSEKPKVTKGGQPVKPQ